MKKTHDFNFFTKINIFKFYFSRLLKNPHIAPSRYEPTSTQQDYPTAEIIPFML